MNYCRMCLVLFILMGVSLTGFAQGTLSSKVNLQAPSDVSSQANRSSGFGSDSVFNNPLINSSLNGYSNMIQGASGNLNNFYSNQEQMKQQGEYAKQQIQEKE